MMITPVSYTHLQLAMALTLSSGRTTALVATLNLASVSYTHLLLINKQRASYQN